ncbi:surfeit locus protein 6 homolog [Gymnodraco acuticeps]|uniref:Surfeit locus protein 6 homolog n=1 Tax=Gymnodraco acuticeps TaxID=8218 RepID=A0A6P8UBY5_GYMAC|nr:surfeit locus protein 6 homolog [Gymnodraco acuticeps]
MPNNRCIAEQRIQSLKRKRLHEKIEESRGQGTPKNALSEAVLAKRKIERERKRRRKEFILKKKLAEENSQEAPVEIKKEPEPAPAANKRDVTALIFNKVETVEEKDKEMENKIKWTNVLYKAEGLKIKDSKD